LFERHAFAGWIVSRLLIHDGIDRPITAVRILSAIPLLTVGAKLGNRYNATKSEIAFRRGKVVKRNLDFCRRGAA
jgi:hypothetical protein